jgi:hypothetical protein
MIFDSLDAFRAHCGEPTMRLERCPICSAIPERCYRETVSSLVADYDVDYGDEGRGHDNVPPQVAQLETFIDGPGRDALMRCPMCHRLYHHRNELEFIGARNYSTRSYDRVDVDTLFRTEWCVSRRLSDRNVEAIQKPDFFHHHAIVRFREGRTWFSLDERNHLIELSSDTLLQVIASDPPSGLDDPARARWYAEFVSEVEDPEVRVVDSIDAIGWRDPLTDEDRERVDAARAASRIEAPTAERADDHIVVRLWVVSKKRLICRIVTVRKTGHVLLEDAVIAEDLPVQ